MKVLVTGGSGHLGAWLVKALAQRGDEVVVLSRSPEVVDYLNFPGVEFIKGDICDTDSLNVAFQGVDKAFHLAAISSGWAKDKTDFDRINVDGTRNVLEAAKNSGVKRVVVVSSAGNFGPSTDGVITEKTIRKLPFLGNYERTKHLADEVAKTYNSPDMEVVIAYPTRVYGPIIHGKPAALNLLIWQLFNNKIRVIPTDGNAIGNYVYIDDVIAGLILAMDNGVAGESYLLGGENLTYNEFYKMTRTALGSKMRFYHIPFFVVFLLVYAMQMAIWFGKAPLITPDWFNKIKMDHKISSEKAVSQLGYRITPFREGIQKTCDFFKTFNLNKSDIGASQSTEVFHEVT